MNDLNILIINPFGVGDVIFSTPLIEVLKDNYPDSFIGYICNKRAYEVIKANPHLNKIFIYEKDDYRITWQKSKIECIKKVLNFLKEIKKEKFDVIIDLSLGYQYSMFLKFIGVRRRLGFNYRNRGRFLTAKVNIDGFNDKHVIEYYLDILKLLNIDTTKYKLKPKVYLTKDDTIWANGFLRDNNIKKEDLLIGIIPGCGASWGMDAEYRRWNKEKFAKVADYAIGRHNAKVVLFGDSKEIRICEDIQRLMKNDVVVACGKTTLGEFIGILSMCKLVITNDGGPLHMAVGLGIKTVSIFGPVDETVYGPYPLDSNHIVISKKEMPCRPCYQKFKYKMCQDRICLKNIKTEEVTEAMDRLLLKDKT